MKHLFIALLFFSSISFVWADRGLYTSELVEGSTFIGVWHRDNVTGTKLSHPYAVLKGKSSNLSQVKKYSSRLKNVVNRIKKEGGFIVFIRVTGDNADLVGDSGAMRYSSIGLKAVKSVISQLVLKKKWSSLPVNEQIEHSDFIVSGEISEEEKECPRDYIISWNKAYRGVISNRLSVVPVKQNLLGNKQLFFIQRHNGAGPDYIVIGAVPLKNSKKYLNKLKEIKVSNSKEINEK